MSTHRSRPPKDRLPLPLTEPAPSPTGRRVYAQVERLSCACPQCGTVCTPAIKGKRGKAYDKRVGFFRCPVCGYGAYIGVVFWPAMRGGGRAVLPEDHTLTPGQAAELRAAMSYAEDPSQLRVKVRGRRTNRECSCGLPCAVHGGAAAGYGLPGLSDHADRSGHSAPSDDTTPEEDR